MSSTQSIMTEVSTQGNSFLPDSTSATKQEIDSINFRESLRFFQEQLINAKKTDLPNGNALKCNLKVDSKRNSIENIIDASKAVEDSEQITVLYTNSKITPIPTVDTILESVRILRAIQKSQSQRGALWTLDITPSDAEALESYKALEIELQKGLTNVESLSSLASETDQLDTDNMSPINTFLQKSNVHDQLDNILADSNGNVNSDSNSSVILPNFASEKDELLRHVKFQMNPHDNSSLTEELTKELSLPVPSHESLKVKSNQTSNYEDLDSQKNNDPATKGLPESDDGLGYPPSDDPEENAEDYLSCCSLCLQDDNNDPKHDLAHGERATSTESDSGMGTDKSVGSLSPVRGEDTEKHLWIESSSSEYASADCSPYESLIRAPEEIVMNNGVDNDFDTIRLQGTSLDDDKLKHDAKEKSNNFYNNIKCPQSSSLYVNDSKSSDNEDKGLENSTSPNELVVASQNQSSITQPCELTSENDECDMSRERLVEVIEDKIQQLELRASRDPLLSSPEASAPSLTVDANIAVEPSDHQELFERQDNELQDPSDAACPITNTENTLTCQNTNSAVNPEICQNDTGADAPCEDDQVANYCNKLEIEQNNHVLEENEHSQEIVECSTLSADKDVYVSSLECKLTHSTLELSQDVEENEEPVRPKKTVTLSWDPVPLVEHLYNQKHDVRSKDSTENKECAEGHLNVLPYGVLATHSGSIFSTIEDGSVYFWETEEKQNLLTSLPLQYAAVEAADANTLILDNRLGRHVKMKFETENELSHWKHILQSHSTPILSAKFLEPVHYPLKSHKNVIIIDLGSCSTRAGILMDQPTLPSIFFPTICATDKTTGKQLYGMDALLPEIRQNSTLTYPVRPSAKITKFTMDIDALKGLFETIFRKLNVNPKDYAIQISIPRSLSTNTQAALMKLLLEDLNVKAVSLTRQALLTLYANNTSTAIVVDIGERMDVLPVVDGFILECGVSRLPYGGQRIIHHMKHALAQKHISLSNDVESLVVQYIFENLCYIADNYDDELRTATLDPETVKKSLALHPFFKGENILQNVTLDIGRFQVPEGLFNPDLWGVDFPGLHKLVHQAIQTSGMDVRRVMAENIYVSGGVTLIPGFVERLQKEIAKLTLPRLKPQVHASPHRYHMAYLGACQLAASDAFPQVCISSKEWHDDGLRSLNKWHL